MLLKRLLLGLILVICCCQHMVWAQHSSPPTHQDENTIKVRTDLTTLLVSVTDQKGNLVNTLTKDDFELSENGIVQEISLFGREDSQPLNLIVLFDTSISVKPKLKFQQQAATKFFKSVLRPIDKAALFNFNHDVMVAQDFTADTEALANAVKSLKAKGGTALYDAIYLAGERLQKGKGRHVIVIISDGANTISKTTRDKALRMADKADAAIYGIYTATRLDEPGVYPGDKELEKICDSTGGEVFFPKDINDLDPSFARLTSVLHTQYALSFSSSLEQYDGTYRNLKIKVKNPDLKVRTRTGYYAPKD